MDSPNPNPAVNTLQGLTKEQTALTEVRYEALQQMSKALWLLFGGTGLTLVHTFHLSEGEEIRPMTLIVTMCGSKKAGLEHCNGAIEAIEQGRQQMVVPNEGEGKVN